MDRETVLLLHLLLIKGHFYTGVSTYDTVSVYHKVGDDAILPCGNVVYPNCSSTTWIYNKHSSATTELVGHGKVKGRERAGRLRVGSNCSLHISNVHTEDAGSYTCQQYLHVGAAPYGGDAPVRLSVLSRSPSSPVTELKPGSTVTLHCLLYTPEGPGQCNKDSAKTITLSWVDERDTPLNKSRFKIENWPPCNSTLTVKLKQKDNNRRWRCQLTEGSDVKMCLNYTTILSGTTSVRTTKTTSTASPPISSSTASPPTSSSTASPPSSSSTASPPISSSTASPSISSSTASPPIYSSTASPSISSSTASPPISSSTASPPSSSSTAGTTAGIVLGCVILCLSVAVIAIYRSRGTGSHPTANQDPGQSADHVTYSDINHSNHITRLKDKESAEELTEYATINTAH